MKKFKSGFLSIALIAAMISGVVTTPRSFAADTKISALPALAQGAWAAGDLFPIVDISAVATKQSSVADFDARYLFAIQAATTAVSGYLLTADWNTFNNKLTSSLLDGRIFVGSAGNVATAQTMSGDATIINSGALTIAASAVTTGKILDGTVLNADIDAAAAIAFSKLATLTSGNLLVGSAGNVATSVAMSSEASMIASGAVTLSNAAVIGKVLTGFVSGAGVVAATDTVLQAFNKLDGNVAGKLSNALTTNNIFVGVAGVATDVAMSGDATIVASGALTIAASAVTTGKILDGTILNADVGAAAAIAFSKLAALTDGNILVGSGANVPTSVAMSGDATIINSGALTIANLAVTNAKIANATIDLTTKVTGVLPLANGGTNAALVAANGAIPYSTAAAFAFLAPGTSGQLLQSGGAGAPTWLTPAFASNVLADGNIFVGSVGNVATAVVMSSEATIINSGAVTLSNAAVIGKVITGFVSGAGAVAATDTLLQAINKLDGNTAGKLSTALTTNNIFVGAAGLATDVAMSGEASIVASGAVTLSNAAVIAKVLTGFTSGAGVVTAADSVLSAFQKIDGNANAKLSNTLLDGRIFVGNGSNVATGVVASGDLSLVNSGAFTLEKIQTYGVDLSIAPSAGDALVYNGADFVASPVISPTAINGKATVVAASTGNLALTGEQTIDGVATSASRILAKDQTTGSENGIYITAAGAWTRATDADSGAELTGAYVIVRGSGGTSLQEGAVFSQSKLVVTVDTDNVQWINAGFVVGGFNEQASNATGASLVHNAFLAQNRLSFFSADASNPGMIDTLTQSITGAKTFLTSIKTPSAKLSGAVTGILTLNAASSTTDHTLTFPATQGAASTLLTNDGAGNLSWAAPTGVAQSSVYTTILGNAGDVTANLATHSTLASAYAATAAGGVMRILANRSFTENLTIDKNISIEGSGYGSVINGTLTFDSASDFSYVHGLKVTGNVTFDAGSTGDIFTNVWTDDASTVVDNGDGNYIQASQF